MTATPVVAQTAKPAPLNISESEVSEATRRQAEGPMRFILQMDATKERKDKAPAAKPAPTAAPPAGAAKPKPSAPATAASNGAATPKPVEPPASATPAAPEPLPLAKTGAPAEPAPAAAAPVIAAAVLAPPKLVSMVEPDISSATRRRLQGAQSATVRFNIAADGSVADAEVLKASNSALRQPVLDAVKQWRYTPPGQVVAQTIELQLVEAE